MIIVFNPLSISAMQPYLITFDEVSKLSRPMSIHIDEEKINAYIRESEDIDLRGALGDALLLDIKENPDQYGTLLDGGVYEDACGAKHVLTGLKTALAYYVYARMVKNADDNVTRFGFVNKDGDYSSRPDYQEKSMAYNDAYSVAASYLKECVAYLNANKQDYPLYKGNGGIRSNLTTYKVIGD